MSDTQHLPEIWHKTTVEAVWTQDGKFGIRFTMPSGCRVTQYFDAPRDLAQLLASAVPA